MFHWVKQFSPLYLSAERWWGIHWTLLWYRTTKPRFSATSSTTSFRNNNKNKEKTKWRRKKNCVSISTCKELFTRTDCDENWSNTETHGCLMKQMRRCSQTNTIQASRANVASGAVARRDVALPIFRTKKSPRFHLHAYFMDHVFCRVLTKIYERSLDKYLDSAFPVNGIKVCSWRFIYYRRWLKTFLNSKAIMLLIVKFEKDLMLYDESLFRER